jgi:hypothetical protein
LIDLPETARRVGQTGGSTRAVVKEGEFTEGTPSTRGPHVLVIDSKANMTLFDDVEEVTGLPLLDNDSARWNRFHHHGINQETAFLGSKTRKDEVILQGSINELDSGIRLWISGCLVLFLEIHGRRKDILGTLCTNAVMNVDILFALDSGGGSTIFFRRRRFRSFDFLLVLSSKEDM